MKKLSLIVMAMLIASSINAAGLASEKQTEGLVSEKSAEKISPAEEFLPVLRRKFSSDCDVQKRKLALDLPPVDKEVLKSTVDMLCNCLPAEIDSISRKSNVNEMSKTELKSELITSTDRCTAQGVRESAFSMCMKDDIEGVKSSDKKSYCQCIKASFDSLSDSDVADASISEYEYYQSRAAAKFAGMPNPEPPANAMRKSAAHCETKYKTSDTEVKLNTAPSSGDGNEK